MAKNIDSGEYLWKFEIWHERSINDASPLLSAEVAASSREPDNSTSARPPLERPNTELHVPGSVTPSIVDVNGGLFAAWLHDGSSSAAHIRQTALSASQRKVAKYSIDDLPEVPDPLHDAITGTIKSKRLIPQESLIVAPDGYRVRRMAELQAFELKLEAERQAARLAKSEAKAAHLAWAQAVYARANAQPEVHALPPLLARLTSYWAYLWCGCTAPPPPHNATTTATTTSSASSDKLKSHEPQRNANSPHRAATESAIMPSAPKLVTGSSEKKAVTRSAPPYKGTAI